MSIKTTIIVLSLLTIQHTCYAQEVEKNGLACVAEICLGDGIAELSKVNWDRAQNRFRLGSKTPQYIDKRETTDRDIKYLSTIFRGDLVKAAPYLGAKQFDTGALKALTQVTAACSSHILEASYTTQNGNPTEVKIALIPNQTDTLKQQWTVISILRKFPAAVTQEQKTEVEQQITKRYQSFKKNVLPKLGEGQFGTLSGSPFGFQLSLYKGNDEENRLKQHPACGGTSKVKID